MIHHFHVSKLTLWTMGSYDKQYRRPFVSLANDLTTKEFVIAALTGMRVGKDRLPIAPRHITREANLLLSPAIDPGKEITNIDFSARRYSFELVVEVETMNHSVLAEKAIYIYRGFSEPIPGDEDKNSCADGPFGEMRFYVNSITQHRYTEFRSVYVLASTFIGEDGRNYLTDEPTDHLIRPTEIFSSAVGRKLNVGNLLDLRQVYTYRPRLSNVGNNIPSRYMAQIINEYWLAVDRYKNEPHAGTIELLQHAQVEEMPLSMFREPLLSDNSGVVINVFTWNAIKTMPGLKTYVIKPTPETLVAAYVAKPDDDVWHSDDFHTHIANLMSNMVVSLMLANGFNQASVNISSVADDHGFVTDVAVVVDVISTALPVTNDEVEVNRKEEFTQHIRQEVYMGVFVDNNLTFNVKILADVNGETMVKIKIDDEVESVYVVPSFCNSMFSPLIVSTRKELDTISEDTLNICYAIETADRDIEHGISSNH